jgi:hypothetical protein
VGTREGGGIENDRSSASSCCVCFLHDRLFNDARSRWGDKENGVAGHGDTEGHQYTPKLLERLSGKKVVQLSACGFHTGCLTDMGEVRGDTNLLSIFGVISFPSYFIYRTVPHYDAYAQYDVAGLYVGRGE